MSVLCRVLFATVVLFCGPLLKDTKAATFDVVGTLDLNGQILSFGPSGAFNFEIDGPIAAPITVGYLLSVSLQGAPSTTSTTTNIVPFIGASANANVNGATTTVDTNNCVAGCGPTHPLFGNAFTISDTQRALSIALAANFMILGAANLLPANDIITIDYNLNLALPQGLSVEGTAVTPLPDSIWLFATGLGVLAWAAWRKRNSELQTWASSA